MLRTLFTKKCLENDTQKFSKLQSWIESLNLLPQFQKYVIVKLELRKTKTKIIYMDQQSFVTLSEKYNPIWGSKGIAILKT